MEQKHQCVHQTTAAALIKLLNIASQHGENSSNDESIDFPPSPCEGLFGCITPLVSTPQSSELGTYKILASQKKTHVIEDRELTSEGELGFEPGCARRFFRSCLLPSRSPSSEGLPLGGSPGIWQPLPSHPPCPRGFPGPRAFLPNKRWLRPAPTLAAEHVGDHVVLLTMGEPVPWELTQLEG